MKIGDIVKNAPNSLIWAVTLVFVAIIGSFTYLAAIDSDATELRAFLNLALNIAATVFAGGAFITAGAAAKSSANADRQINGETPPDAG